MSTLVGDFYEEDEDPEVVEAAFRDGVKGFTAPWASNTAQSIIAWSPVTNTTATMPFGSWTWIDGIR